MSLQAISTFSTMQIPMRRTVEGVEKMIRLKITHRDMPFGNESLGYHLRGYHQLTRTETDAAIQMYRSGGSVDELREHPLFAPKLEAEKAAFYRMAGLPVYKLKEPVNSYQLLFHHAPGIDMLVSLGHYRLIVRWCRLHDQVYKDLALPLDDFFNTALYEIVPEEARSYIPDPAYPGFEVWASRMLFWRLQNVVRKRERELSTLTLDGRGGSYARAHKDSLRREIVSLDRPVEDARSEKNPSAEIETLSEALPGNLPGPEKLEDQSALTALFRLAGLTANEQKALVALTMYDYEQKEVGKFLRRDERMVRYYRDHALAKLRALGDKKTILAILKGDIDEV
jgi:DNA-directed RNA polymerase specialized sigma24 family protein